MNGSIIARCSPFSIALDPSKLTRLTDRVYIYWWIGLSARAGTACSECDRRRNPVREQLTRHASIVAGKQATSLGTDDASFTRLQPIVDRMVRGVTGCDITDR